MSRSLKYAKIASGCLAALAIAACGVGELGASAAAAGGARAQESKRVEETQSRIEQRLEDANAEAAKRRDAIEASAQ
jgi:hypothetical protein